MEVDAFTPATPSRGSSAAVVHTPPAPLHGFSDSWEPYSPRKSARLSQQNATTNNRTPSPHPSTQASTGRHSQSVTSKARRTVSMASPAISPRKKRAPAMDSSRRASGALTVEATASAAAALGLTDQTEFHPGQARISAAGGMLITPAKTPQQPPSKQAREKIQAVARSLFSDHGAMPSPKKARSQKSTIDSFAEDNSEEAIPIYTDSHERIPVIDRSQENPFFGENTFTAEAPRRSKRAQFVTIPGEGDVPLEEAVRRKDGMIIVFRGKKQFRKFGEAGEAEQQPSFARRLFPRKAETKAQQSNFEDEEEAMTDIEDPLVEVENQLTTPTTMAEDLIPGTPPAPKFAPASPPTTMRSTRFGKKVADSTPLDGKQPKDSQEATRGKRSPFDGWRRVKGGSRSDSMSQKRNGDTLSSGSPKRHRA